MRRSFGTNLGFGVLLAVLALAAPMDAIGATLTGKVLGQSGQPKALLRVDARGAEQRVTVTAGDGKYVLDLPPGTYTVEIREGNRVVQFPVSIPAGTAQVKRDFALPW